MADIDEGRKGKRSFSQMDSTEIIRNVADIVDEDGIRSHGLLELLSCIQMDLRNGGIVPLKPIVVRNTVAVTRQQLIFCPAESRIVIFDIFVSLNAATTISFINQDNTRVMADMIAPNPGQGFCRTSERGVHLGNGESLCYTCSGAVTHSIDISYAIIPA
jgi:hypothetical protein